MNKFYIYLLNYFFSSEKYEKFINCIKDIALNDDVDCHLNIDKYENNIELYYEILINLIDKIYPITTSFYSFGTYLRKILLYNIYNPIIKDVPNDISFHEIILGGNLKVNRTSLENVQIDVLSRPYLKRYDAGLNHILAREAKDNNVAVELFFTDILKSYLSYRSKVLANFRDIYRLHKKYDFPLILSSGAESIFDIRTVQDFKAVFTQTGLDGLDVNNSFKTAENILKFNSNRKNLILSGVRVVE